MLISSFIVLYFSLKFSRLCSLNQDFIMVRFLQILLIVLVLISAPVAIKMASSIQRMCKVSELINWTSRPKERRCRLQRKLGEGNLFLCCELLQRTGQLKVRPFSVLTETCQRITGSSVTRSTIFVGKSKTN